MEPESPDPLDELFAAAPPLGERSSRAERELSCLRVLAKLVGNTGDVSLPLGPFAVVRCVGRGGMGTVFEAVDRRSGAKVALKVLNEPPDEALSRLKREFRALRDVTHTHLVSMYELHVVGDIPFFTMELVDGPCLAHLLERGVALGVRFIMRCVLQLAQALSTIHGHGTLHGDIKPSNLLVERGGRLKVLDFGVSRVLGESASWGLSGTAGYIAPERQKGEPATAASDWFAAGAVLEQLLASVREPTSAPDRERLARLRALCAGLLRPSSTQRFGRDEVFSALSDRTRAEGHVASPWPARDAAFVGRGAELARLTQAFRDVSDRPLVCCVRGEAGIGKTALIERFLDSPELRRALVLCGRCFEDESLPYKGVEGVIEALADYLEGWDAALRAALDVDTDALLSVFPDLRRAGFAPSRAAPALSIGPRHLRRRAFAQLGALLSRLSRHGPLVLFVDDLQWGDADGAALLRHLVTDPAAPPMLVIGSFRGAGDDACASALRMAPSLTVDLVLSPLEPEACEALAAAVLGQRPDVKERDDLLRESGGSPLLLHALLRAGVAPVHGTRTFVQLMKRSLSELDPAARELVMLVALSGCPVSLKLLGQAIELADDPRRHLSALRKRRLVRGVPSKQGLLLLPHHDRVREVMSGLLAAEERARYHFRLARAAALTELNDPEFLAQQYMRAGELSAAAPHAELAGDRARATMALERARVLYAQALECMAPARPRRLIEKLADVADSSGDLKGAGALYLEAESAAGQDGFRLRLRAAEIYLQSGAEAEAMRLLRPAMREAHIPVPSSMAHALVVGAVSLLRCHLAGRGSAAEAADAPEDLRTELAFRGGYLISLHDAKGAALILWSAARALRHGSGPQRGRALASMAHVYALLRVGTPAEQDALLERSLRLTREEPMAHAAALANKALVAFGRSECDQALRALDQAASLVVERRLDAQWILAQVRTLVLSVCVLAGDFERIRELAPEYERQALEGGNRTVLAQLQSSLAWAHLSADAPEAMHRYTAAMFAQWRAPRLSPLYGIAVWCEGHRLLYVGDVAAARRLMQKEAPRFVRSGLSRTQLWAMSLGLLWGTIELACARAPDDPHARAAQKHARKLEGEPLPCAQACAALLRAGLSRRAGQANAAARQYRQASQGFSRLGMHGYAAVAAYRGAELVCPAGSVDDAWFVSQSIAEPSRWVAMYAP